MELNEIIQNELNRETLSDKEKIILASYFGLSYRKLNMEEIAKSFGVSRERIRQIVAKALKKIGL
jgi:RNA polymerase primary sigma factor